MTGAPYIPEELRPYLELLVKRMPGESAYKYRWFEHYLTDIDPRRVASGRSPRSARRVSVHFGKNYERVKDAQSTWVWTARAAVYDMLRAQEGEDVVIHKSKMMRSAEDRYESAVDEMVTMFESLTRMAKKYISQNINKENVDIESLIKMMTAFERIIHKHISSASPLNKTQTSEAFNEFRKGLLSNPAKMKAMELTAEEVEALTVQDLATASAADVSHAIKEMGDGETPN